MVTMNLFSFTIILTSMYTLFHVNVAQATAFKLTVNEVFITLQ